MNRTVRARGPLTLFFGDRTYSFDDLGWLWDARVMVDFAGELFSPADVADGAQWKGHLLEVVQVDKGEVTWIERSHCSADMALEMAQRPLRWQGTSWLLARGSRYCIQDAESARPRLIWDDGHHAIGRCFATVRQAQEYAEALEQCDILRRTHRQVRRISVTEGDLDVLVCSLCAELDRRSFLDRGVPYRDGALRPFVATVVESPAWARWPRKGPLADAVSALAGRFQMMQRAAERLAVLSRRRIDRADEREP